MSRRETSLLRMAATVAIAAIVIAWLGLRFADAPRTPAWETPKGRAHRVCGRCGLELNKIDEVVETMNESPRDREALMRLCRQSYDGNEALEQACEPCGECADAILDAAESENP